MYYLDEYKKRFSSERYDDEQSYRSSRHYDERRARERQIVEIENVPYSRARDSTLIRERDSVLTSERDPHFVREKEPILVRERDLKRYHRTYLENEKTREGEHFSGQEHHFPEPRIPGPRMPFYQPQHRPPAFAPRGGGPSWQQPFYRNNLPRRRHHLDDIFLPNHDEEDSPPHEEEGFRPRHPNVHYRPPIRVEIKTTKTETITKDKILPTTKSNDKGSSEKVSASKVHERAVTLNDRKLGTSSESVKSNVKDDVKNIGNSSDNNRNFNVSKSSALKINERKSLDGNNISAHKSFESGKQNETKRSSDQDNLIYQINSTTSKELIKKNETKITNDKNILASTSKLVNKKGDIKTPEQNDTKINNDKNISVFSSRSISKKQDIKTPEHNKVKTNFSLLNSSTNTSSRNTTLIYKEHEKTDGYKTSWKKEENTNADLNSANRRITSEETQKHNQRENIRKEGGEQQTKKQSKDAAKITSPLRKIQNQKSHGVSNETRPDRITNVISKSASSKLIVENKDKEKLSSKDNVGKGKTTENVTPEMSNYKNDKKGDPNVQNKMDSFDDVPCKLQENEAKENTLKSKNEISKKVENSSPKEMKGKCASDSEIDIVKELEALVNQSDEDILKRNKRFEKEANRDQKSPKSKSDTLTVSLTGQKEILEGSLTQDTTPTSLPASTQAIKKDIKIKLIRLPLSKSPLADKANENCDKDLDLNTNPQPSSKICSEESSFGDAKAVNDNKVIKLADAGHCGNLNTLGKGFDNLNNTNKFGKVSQPKNSISADNLNINNVTGSNEKNDPILEDIFILEDALENIDKPPEIIEIPSSPPKADSSIGNLSTHKKSVFLNYCATPKRSTNINSEEIQIIEEKYDTIEILDDDLGPTSIKHSNIKTTSPVLIKIESPDDSERNSRSSTNVEVGKTLAINRSFEDFSNLDTRGSFLWTFHQRFDDPRVVDMDISHSPPPPDISIPEVSVTSEEQKETDRFIKDMDALWNEISNNKIDESNKSKKTAERIKLQDSNEITSLTSDKSNCGNEVSQVAVEAKVDINADVTSTEQNLNTCAQDTLVEKATDKNKKIDPSNFAVSFSSLKSNTVKLVANNIRPINIHRRASFSHESNINGLERPIRKTKSLDCIISHNQSYSFPTSMTNELIGQNTVEIYQNKSKTVGLKKLISDDGMCLTSPIKESNMSLIEMAHSGGNRRLDRIPETVPNDPIIADSVNRKKVDINQKKSAKEIKRKRVMRIESSDEEYTEEASSVLEKGSSDQPKHKKMKLKEKATRKRKCVIEEEKKNKEPKKDTKTSLPVNKRSQKKSLKLNRSTSLPNKTANKSAPDTLTSASTQLSTKYVTKAEYIKSFAKNKSLVPNISLSIESVPKVQKIKQRRATFTCETDNETILKKVERGERCKQKFLDLFGSVSEDEEDLVQVPLTELCKTSLKRHKKEEGLTIPEIRNKPDVATSSKDKIVKKGRRPNISEPLIEKNNIHSGTNNSPDKSSKKRKISYDTDDINCKRMKVQNEVSQDRPEHDSIKIPQSDDNNSTLNKDPDNETTTSKLNRQKSTEKCTEKKVTNPKDTNKKLNLSNRRESNSSTDSRSRDSNSQEHQKERKHSAKPQHEKAARVSRSRSKESDSSIISDGGKRISKNGHSKGNKEKSLNKDLADSIIKSKLSHTGKEKSFPNSRRGSNTSVESNNSQHSHNKNNAIDNNLIKKIGHHRKSLSKERQQTSNGNDTKETNMTALKQKHEEITKVSCGSSNGTETHLKTHLSVSENKKKTASEHFQKSNKKLELVDQNKIKDNQFVMKTNNKSPSNEASSSSNKQQVKSNKNGFSTQRTCSANIFCSSTKINSKDKGQSKPNTDLNSSANKQNITQELEVESDNSKDNADPIKKLDKSSKENSTLDSSSSSETSLIIGEITDLPLLYRASEGEINETFETCQGYTPQVIQHEKITKITIADAECRNKVYINRPPEINTDMKIVKQTLKEDDDVIEIRPVIPMVDLTEEDACSEPSPQETLSDLILEAKKEIEELARDPATITLYRAEEADTNQDEEVQAVAASIPSVLTERNKTKIKGDKDLLQQNATLASTEVLQSSSNKVICSDKEMTDLNKTQPKASHSAEGTVETVSVTVSQLYSSLIENLISSETTSQKENMILNNPSNKSSTMESNLLSQLPVTRETPASLENENQQAVSSILNIQKPSTPLQDENQRAVSSVSIQETPASSENENQVSSILNIQRSAVTVSTNLIGEIQQSTAILDSTNLQPLLGSTTPHQDTANRNFGVENSNHLEQSNIASNPQQINNINTNHGQNIFNIMEGNSIQHTVYTSGKRAEQFNNPEKQNGLNYSECPKTCGESQESIQVPCLEVTEKNKRPRIIVRPTRTENTNNLNIALQAAQHRVQEDLSGQHRGLPQTLRQYRPTRRIKATTAVVPPALVTINNSPIAQPKTNQASTFTSANIRAENSQTSFQNLEITSTIQNSSVGNNQFTSQNSGVSTAVIDLTEDSVSVMDMRIIVDIFTRHAYFLAHLCQAQNGYIDYLQKLPFCQHYFRAEVALFEEQKRARLNSQSLRLVTELHNLNIRATRNLSAAASEIIERLAVNLANRNMPQQVTRSMVFLLVDQLISPQAELFARVPLLKSLIRVCNIVCSRIYSKCPNSKNSPLTESQREILAQQVREYNRLFGILPLPQNNPNQDLGFGQSNTERPTSNNHSSTNICQPRNQNVHTPQLVTGVVHTTTGNALSNQTGQSIGVFGRQMSVTNPTSANIRQPSDNTPLARLSRQFGLPNQSLLKSSNNSLTITGNASNELRGVNLGQGNSIQVENSPTMRQTSVLSNSMKPPSLNIPIIRQQRLVSPRKPSTSKGLNKSSVKSTQDLPGGANTNTLGCTPRYIPNYDTSNQSYTYASIGRPQQQSQILNVVSENVNSLNHNLPPPGLNSQDLRNANNQILVNNPLLSGLLSDRNSPGPENVQAQHSPSVLHRPHYTNLEQSFLQSSHNNVISESPRHNISLQSPRHNILFQSPRHTIVSQSPLREGTFRQPPSYDKAVANKQSHLSGSSSPNQLSAEEVKKRSENLLKELLSTSDNEPLFARPSSPANDNFRIKLPFTQPDATKSTTVHTTSTNSSFIFNAVNTGLSVCQSSVPISSIAVSTTSYRVPNNSIMVSESTTLSLQANPNPVCSQLELQSHQSSSLISLSPQFTTSQPSILFVNNTAASTSYVVGQPKQTVVLNQGLAALSSIGAAASMLNSSSLYIPNSQQPTNVQNSLQYQSPTVPGVQTVNPVLIVNGSEVSSPQNQTSVQATNSPVNKEVARSPTFAQIRPRPPVVSDLDQPNKTVARTAPAKSSAIVSKPETKTKPKRSKLPRQRRPKKGAKPIEIVDLLSSDDDDTPSENDEVRTPEEPECNSVKKAEAQFQVEFSKATFVTVTGEQPVELQQSCASQVPHQDSQSSTSDTQNKDPPPSAHQNESGCNQTPDTQNQTKDPQPSTSDGANHLESADEGDDAETIDLTWIDDIDDQELQREMNFVFIKKEEPRDEDDQEQERNNMVVPSPADSGISSPPVEGEDDTTIYTVNVQRLCICGATAQYNCVCGEGWYCGQECQLKDWESHQNVCQMAQETMHTEEELVIHEQEVDVPDET